MLETTNGCPALTRVRFNLFWAIIQTAGGVVWLAAPVIIFIQIAGERGKDPVMPALVVFVFGAIPGVPLGYFGLRGLSRQDQIVFGADGLSGALVTRDNQVVSWDEITKMQYTSRGFVETLTLWLRNDRRVVIRDLSQLGPMSLLEISETVKTRIETGVFVPPKPVRWWQTTWAALIFVLLFSIAIITVMNLFGGRK